MVNPEYLAWCQMDQMILSVLISTLTKSYVAHVVGCATTSTLWNTLVTMFASQARAHVMQIYFQLSTVRKGNNSITKYFQTIKTLSDTLAAAGQPFNDFESDSFLLKGLGFEFDPFVMFVTAQVDPLSFDELYEHLLAHEMWIEQQLPSLDLAQPSDIYTSRAATHRGRGNRGRGFSFGGRTYFRGRGAASSTHGRGSYFNNDAAPSSRPICQLCGRIGHTTARCYQRLESAHLSKSQQHPQAYQQNPQAYYSSFALPTKENWYPDTWVTHPVTNELQHLNLSTEEYQGKD
jgi:hypothetical protein